MLQIVIDKLGWSVQDTQKYLTDNRLDLHHSSRNTAQIIPRDLYSSIRHTGPASVMRNKKKIGKTCP